MGLVEVDLFFSGLAETKKIKSDLYPHLILKNPFFHLSKSGSSALHSSIGYLTANHPSKCNQIQILRPVI